MGERQSRNEKRYMTEAQALGSALQDALADLVQVHGVQYLDVFLERRLNETVERLRQDVRMSVPSILAAQRSTADDAEAALRREVESVITNRQATSTGDHSRSGSPSGSPPAGLFGLRKEGAR
jgi:hypothetical protein